MRVMSQLAIDGLHDGVRFATDGDGAAEIGVGKRLDGGEDTVPACFPFCEKRFARGGRIDEFAVAVARGLFTVGGEEIGKSGAHVADHVLDDDGDGVGLWIEDREELFVADLLHGALGELLVVAEERERVGDVGGCEFERHGKSVAGAER